MAPAEWPQLNGKVRPYQEATENLRWGSQSEGQPDWASPAGSVVSEQSLASLKAVRTAGSSPPPPAPPLRGASPKVANGSGEVRILETLDADTQAQVLKNRVPDSELLI